MDDQEFDLLDELYFVKNFAELKEALEMDSQTIQQVLKRLLEKHWIKILDAKDNEVHLDEAKFEQEFENYHFIATKAGLLAHNGR